MKKVKEFLHKKDINISAKLYFVDAMGAMAQGLFATLLMGTILKTLGQYTGLLFLIQAASFATSATGAVLGLSVAFALKAPPLVLYSASVVGLIGYDLGITYITAAGAEKVLAAGPAGSFLTAIVACEIGKLVYKQTKIDILVTPVTVILAGFGVAKLICGPIAWVMAELGNFINTATVLQPVLMGIIISAIVGIILTLPISSAAICAMIGISGIAGGAAAAGCCAQMVGFAVISFKENKWGGLVAQGLGTSMLQMGNIVKNPRIWIPATAASMITGPLASAVFKLECTGVSAGMGTCGLVGPLGIFSATSEKDAMFWIGLLLVCFLLPAILSLIFSEILRKIGWIKENDMKLEL
ncbi:MAG: PTS sugar transporter subunit IIC [Oscillospiraceae bacterium]|nr:PTS sugar transporter subunit IIC [Oscillospiraceae bacterium]